MTPAADPNGNDSPRGVTNEESSDDAQAFYGRWALLYDLLARRTPGIAALRKQAALACRLEPGDTVVEMGCGTGANLPYLADQVGPTGTVIGIDFTGPVLERARRATANYENVHVIRGNATAPPLEGPVDAVLATFVVGMLEDPAGVVDDWCELLSPNGHLVLVNAARSEGRFAPVVNALFTSVVIFSTPPTTKLRYEEDLTATLDERITAAHERLRTRSSAVAEARHAGGIVRLTGGRIATE
ncbi:methyltransferase domain-containing protein [Halobacteria archaeon AArc-curdl1]|uniref:Methyltransferase domain-containing protein n=1 Tax=Natronosalvus hydrolyticus TaxID=2979988 RepID=A0AAP3E6Z5_9EURY|nr:methyltransferase domain-containing protein [Halobacteria archaeon AArc-curdl1]